jgi:IS1 family transposase
MVIELVEKEDVEDISPRSKFGSDDLYRKKIVPHIERIKSLIENSSTGEIEVKIKDLKNLMGEEFKDRNVNSFYSMLKLILIENGINVKLHHHYGANVILSFAKEEEIRSSIDIVRERMLKTAKNAGYDRYADYIRNYQMQKRRYKTNMYDKEDKHYFVTIGRKYISAIFPNAIINWDLMANVHTVEKGGYDWISNGLKVKHLASTLRHKVDPPSMGKKGFERDLFQWYIANNNKADAFILTAWDNSENLDLMKAWFFNKGDIVNSKEFWNRTSFLISTSDRSMDKYCEYEVDDDKLDLIRNKILHDQEIEQGISNVNIIKNTKDEMAIIRINEEKIRKESIENFYSTIFRTITWERCQRPLGLCQIK